MSVFKRLGNVARGKMMEIGRNLSGDGSDAGDPDEVRPDLPPPRRAEGGPAPSPAKGPEPSKRELLDRLRAEGLLTDEEHAQKLAALDAPSGPPTPRKRRL